MPFNTNPIFCEKKNILSQIVGKYYRRQKKEKPSQKSVSQHQLFFEKKKVNFKSILKKLIKKERRKKVSFQGQFILIDVRKSIKIEMISIHRNLYKQKYSMRFFFLFIRRDHIYSYCGD